MPGHIRTYHFVSFIGEDKPVLQDLLRIAPQYAARWREIGIELQLKDYDLDNIDLDNAYHPYRTVQCFRCVLEQWLKEISSPNWGKLDDAIKGELSKIPRLHDSEVIIVVTV